jgi:hypothetical protein
VTCGCCEEKVRAIVSDEASEALGCLSDRGICDFLEPREPHLSLFRSICNGERHQSRPAHGEYQRASHRPVASWSQRLRGPHAEAKSGGGRRGRLVLAAEEVRSTRARTSIVEFYRRWHRLSVGCGQLVIPDRLVTQRHRIFTPDPAQVFHDSVGRFELLKEKLPVLAKQDDRGRPWQIVPDAGVIEDDDGNPCFLTALDHDLPASLVCERYPGSSRQPLDGSPRLARALANLLVEPRALNSDPAFRGRVMALYVMVFLGSTPIGGPIVGWVAEQFGARTGLGLGGLATVIASAGLLWGLAHWHVGQLDRSPRPMTEPGLAARVQA